MNANTSLRLLLVFAVTIPLVTFWVDGAENPGAEDWAEHVDAACTSRRYGICLAAARKVARGGDSAVPAVEAYAGEHGLDALPQLLVDAIADSGHAGPAVSRLLWSWATSPDFFWRASAMRGLALRVAFYEREVADAGGTGFDHAQLIALMSERAEHDPAWLMRTHSRLGLALDGTPLEALFAMPEQDPRARLRLATLLLRQGRVPPMQVVVDALADERTFLGTPWGRILASEAIGELRRWLGDDFPDLDPGDKPAAIAVLQRVVESRTGQSLAMPTIRVDRVANVIGGIELLSCQHGDQFVQWTGDGTVYLGLDAARQVSVPADAWQDLARDRTAIELQQDHGVVTCDCLRLCVVASETNVRIAPGSTPRSAMDWLQRLARSLADAGEPGISAHLLRGLDQFRALDAGPK